MDLEHEDKWLLIKFWTFVFLLLGLFVASFFWP